LRLDTGNTVINDGILEATGAGGLVIENTTVDDSGGGSIEGNGGSSVELQNAVIVGGTLHGAIVVTGSTASTLDGTEHDVINTGNVRLSDGDQLTLNGTIDNTGTIALDSVGSPTELQIGAAGVTLDGGGTLILSDTAANIIIGMSASATLTNV